MKAIIKINQNKRLVDFAKKYNVIKKGLSALYLDADEMRTTKAFKNLNLNLISPNIKESVVSKLKSCGVITAHTNLENFIQDNKSLVNKCVLFYFDFQSTPAGNSSTFPFEAIYNATKLNHKKIIMGVTFSTRMREFANYSCNHKSVSDLVTHQLESGIFVENGWQIMQRYCQTYTGIIHYAYALKKIKPNHKKANYCVGLKKIQGYPQIVYMGFKPI